MKLNQLDEVFNNYAWRQEDCIMTLAGRSIQGRRMLLPLPVSENKRLMAARNRKVLINTPEYNRWLGRASSALMKSNFPKFSEDKNEAIFVFTIIVYKHPLRDVIDYEKALYDSFQRSGHVFENDRQIKERHTKGIQDKSAPCEYVVTYLCRQSELPSKYDFVVTKEQIEAMNAYITKGFELDGRKIRQ